MVSAELQLKQGDGIGFRGPTNSSTVEPLYNRHQGPNFGGCNMEEAAEVHNVYNLISWRVYYVVLIKRWLPYGVINIIEVLLHVHVYSRNNILIILFGLRQRAWLLCTSLVLYSFDGIVY